jgi:DNA-binding LacI/PurR family transcriptional regulator
VTTGARALYNSAVEFDIEKTPMARTEQGRKKNQSHSNHGTGVTLKAVANHLGLTPGTVSAVLNNSVACRSVLERAKKRIFAAARGLEYRPNYLARTLRVKRSSTIGVIAAEVGDPYGQLIISGIERYLRANGFFYLTAVHRHHKELLESYSRLLLERGVEGFITVDTPIVREPPLPTVAVAGHRPFAGVTNIALDHKAAAFSALRHLLENGHREFAFMKGPVISSDTESRWQSIVEASRELGIRIHPDLVVELNEPQACAARAPEYAYPFAKELLGRNRAFTALFAFNDNSAIAAISAFQDAGLRVPENVSVIGFDDIPLASYSNPTLTTVRQPLQKMGEIAARTLLDRIENRSEYVAEIAIETELIVRRSTGPAPKAI